MMVVASMKAPSRSVTARLAMTVGAGTIGAMSHGMVLQAGEEETSLIAMVDRKSCFEITFLPLRHARGSQMFFDKLHFFYVQV